MQTWSVNKHSRYYIFLASMWIFTSMSPVSTCVSVGNTINFTITCVCESCHMWQNMVIETKEKLWHFYKNFSELHVNITAERVLCFIVHYNTKSHVKTFPVFFQSGVLFRIPFPGHIPWDHYHCRHSVTEGLWVNSLTVESFSECKQGGRHMPLCF